MGWKFVSKFVPTSIVLQILSLKKDWSLLQLSTVINGSRLCQTVRSTSVLCAPKSLPNEEMQNPTLNNSIAVFNRRRLSVMFAGSGSAGENVTEMSIWEWFIVSLKPWCVGWTLHLNQDWTQMISHYWMLSWSLKILKYCDSKKYL